jgi:hypothetical protein
VTTALDRASLLRRIQPGRLLAGAAATLPTLVEELQDARYVVEHREEIQDAITHLEQNAPAQDELQRSIDESTETLGAIETAYSEVDQARSVLAIDGVRHAATCIARRSRSTSAG